MKVLIKYDLWIPNNGKESKVLPTQHPKYAYAALQLILDKYKAGQNSGTISLDDENTNFKGWFEIETE